MSMRLTPAVKALLIACFAMYIVQIAAVQGLGFDLLKWLGLVPVEFALNGKIWQLITYSFLHGDVLHLFLNLFVLAFMGGELESLWGSKRFLGFYFFCVAFAGLTYLGLQYFVWGGLNSPLVGASGGIYGLLMAYGLIFGERMMLAMMVFPIKAKHFVWILVAMELLSSFSRGSALSSAAHLGGMAGGFVYLWVAAMKRVRAKQLKTSQGKGKSKKRKGSHLKLVINNAREGMGEGGSEDLDPPGPKTWH